LCMGGLGNLSNIPIEPPLELNVLVILSPFCLTRKLDSPTTDRPLPPTPLFYPL